MDVRDERRLLLIDDEEAILASFELAFDDEGWVVTTADSGEAAMEIFAAGKFDLVITDKNLPMMSGVDLVAQIRDVDRSVTIMMLTGYGSAASAIDTLNLGVDAYIEKPVRDVFRLSHRAQTIMKRRRREMELAAPSGNTSAQPFRALVLCADASRSRFILEHLSGLVDEVKTVADLAAARPHIPRSYSLVVIDESTPEFIEAVAALTSEAPQLPVVLAGEAMSLGLEVLMGLIDHGVSSFIKEPLGSAPCAERFAESVAQVRRG